MERALSIVVAAVALGLMGRWGVRSARLRREHGPPPPGAVRRIFHGVTAGYVVAGGMLVWWLLGDLIRPAWLQLALALAASAASNRFGIVWEGRPGGRDGGVMGHGKQDLKEGWGQAPVDLDHRDQVCGVPDESSEH